MVEEQALVFLAKMNKQIDEGQFDSLLTIPFMSRELMRTNIKARIDKKLATNGTPLLSETEINDVIETMKETAVETTAIFLKMGILERTDAGLQYSEAWRKAVNTI